jgi:hypothetical protein
MPSLSASAEYGSGTDGGEDERENEEGTDWATEPKFKARRWRTVDHLAAGVLAERRVGLGGARSLMLMGSDSDADSLSDADRTRLER